MSRSLLVYVIKSRTSVFRSFRVQTISIDGKDGTLFGDLSVFTCTSNPAASWRKSGQCALDSWLPFSDKAASGLVHTMNTAQMPSLYTIAFNCADESETPVGFVKVPIKCSMEEDQGVACLPITDSSGSELDSLYLYYVFAHTHNPPVTKTPPPRGIRLNTVNVGLENHLINGYVKELWPPERPILIGHGGAGMRRAHFGSARQWPDNTICAFRRAEQLGLPMVECDATVTKDYQTVLLHHNFTVRFQSNPILDEDCDRSFNLEYLPDPPVDETTTNLVVGYSLPELRSLLGRDPNDCLSAESQDDCIMHPEALTATDPLPDRHGADGHPLPELAEAFRQTSTKLGFNVELKYPRETLLGKISRAIQLDLPITPTLAGPHSYFAKINKFCDKILDTIWRNAGHRVVVLSSFNADVCAVLRLKQSHLPVMFITRGGVSSPTEPPNMFHVDVRHTNLAVAISWAKVMGLDGVVTLGAHFGSTPSKFPLTDDEIAANARLMAENELACFVYGDGVSDPGFFITATKCGLGGVIIDRVDGYMEQHSCKNSM